MIERRFFRAKTPGWLKGLTADLLFSNPLPLKNVLRNSLFYPSSAFDGDPVKYFSGNIHSFVYADYGYSVVEFQKVVDRPGFFGYEAIATRSIPAHELNWHGFLTHLDKNNTDNQLELFSSLGWVKQPFCFWTVFQRREDRSPKHGPSRFSLLYLCADGAAAYQALYVANSVAPKAIAVIQPGHGFGHNWTNFEDPNQILARTVAANPAGKPEILLYGGSGSPDYYLDPCWPEYGKNICFLDKAGGGVIGAWRLSSEVGTDGYSESWV